MISPMVERVHLARCSGGLRRAARARSDAGGAGRRAPTQGAGSTVFWCCARWRVTPSRMVTCSRMARKYMKSTHSLTTDCGMWAGQPLPEERKANQDAAYEPVIDSRSLFTSFRRASR